MCSKLHRNEYSYFNLHDRTFRRHSYFIFDLSSLPDDRDICSDSYRWNLEETPLVKGGAKSTMSIRDITKESSQKQVEDWFEPVLNIHTSLHRFPPTLTPILWFAPLELSIQKELFIVGKNIGQEHLPPPLPTSPPH